jgi:hypothetical protein
MPLNRLSTTSAALAPRRPTARRPKQTGQRRMTIPI